MPRNRSLVALLVVAAWAVPALGQDTVDLKWKFEKGKTFYQEMTTSTKQEMEVMGMKINQTQSQTFYFSWTPESEKDKAWTIKQKIVGVKMNIEIAGNTITFDSTKDAGSSNPLSDFFKALVGSEFTLTVGPDYKVTDIKGDDEFLKKLIAANQQMEPLLRQILSKEALKQMADPAFAVLPDKPVKKGDAWKRTSNLNMGPIGSYESTYNYTYQGKNTEAKDEKEKKYDKITVDTTLKYVPPMAGAGANLPFKITEAKLETDPKDAKAGVILFDGEKGRIVSSEMTVKLKGNLKIEISGTSADVKLNQEQTTTVKTTDEDPTKKGS